jgi:hydrophobic/amphiphilic exporter-1 (mainly G- bacteria), HAE1 family
MFLSKLSVQRPVFTTMLVVAMIVMGAFGYMQLSIELMPDVDFPVVMVTTVYPGAGPEEVETQVTKRIEDAVSTIANIDLLESYSQESVSFVVLQFDLEVSSDAASNDVRAKIDGILNSLPSGAEKPVVQKFEMGARPIVSLAVSSDRGVNGTYAVADKTIRDRLSQVSGVANVEIIGGQEREIQVAVDPAKLDHYGLPITALSQAIAMENMNIPQGRIVEPDEEFTVRMVGEFASLDDLREVPLALPNGGFIHLRDVAKVRDSFEEARSQARFNSVEAVQVSVIKRPGANTIATADEIYKAVDSLREELPSDFVIEFANDDSNFIRDSVRDVQTNIMIGVMLTALLLFIFLRNWRGTIVAAVVMPAAIVATFFLIQMADFTLNVMSLMALGISVGILVTNAIVVLENILRHLQEGKEPAVAAEIGTDEVALAVVASVMTNVVVFVPIAFMEGIVGRFFMQFGLTVVFATIFSLIISFTLTPMLSSVILKRVRPAESKEENKPTRMDKFMQNLADGYRGLLSWSFKKVWRFSLLNFITLLFFVLAMVLFGLSGGEFMPRIDEGYVFISLEMPAGSSLDRTTATVKQVEQILSEEATIASVLSTIGGSGRGINEATIQANLVPKGDRAFSAYEISNDLRPKMAMVPEADLTVTSTADEGGGSSADLVIEIMGDDPAALETISEEVLAILWETEGLVDVSSSLEEGGRELVFHPDRQELARRGLSTVALAMMLRNAYEGDESSVYREYGEEYKIRVQLEDEFRSSPKVLSELRIAAGPTLLPLSQLGELSEERGDAEILRRDRQRRITVTANIGQGTVSDIVALLEPQFDEIDKPTGSRIVFGGMYEFQQEAFASIFQAMILAIILTYVVLAMILESFIHPLTVMVTLPLGLIGSSMGLFFGGATINIMSLMAMVMLVGIVVNNAILLLDYVSQLRAKGRGLEEALLEACPLRLRAVIMTNLAIAVGMLPQVIGKGSGIEYRIAMAVVTIGGVLVSAIFTLILIPSLYYYFERIMAWLKGAVRSA